MYDCDHINKNLFFIVKKIIFKELEDYWKFKHPSFETKVVHKWQMKT